MVLSFIMLFFYAVAMLGVVVLESYFAKGGNVLALLQAYVWKFVVVFGIILLSGVVMLFYFYNSRREFLVKRKSLVIIFLSMVMTFLFSSITGAFLSPYFRPMALAVLLVAICLDRKTAIIANVNLSLAMFTSIYFLGTENLEEAYFVLLVGMIGGFFTAIAMSKRHTRLGVIFTSFQMAVPYAIISVLVVYLFHGAELLLSGLWAIVSPLLSVAIFMVVLPLFEAGFRIVTTYRISELSDMTRGLLKEFAQRAPGTFNHSLSVTNLAIACAAAIGESPSLMRAIAYYHDVGKMTAPELFTENQKNGKNPHDDFTPELSVNFIRKHVSDGVAILKKHHLPDEIIAGAAEHHGTMPIKFFYAKAKKFTDGQVNVADYSYDGALPSSKLTAILMIADASEAAIRSLKDRSSEKIDEVVRSIIEERMDLGQFDNCDITFLDLKIIRETIVTSFAGILHDRVEYPKLRLSRQDS